MSAQAHMYGTPKQAGAHDEAVTANVNTANKSRLIAVIKLI